MTYAVTGASGQLGRLVTDRVLVLSSGRGTRARVEGLAAVDPSELVLLTRDPAKLADAATRGADVRVADFADPDTLAAAFAGVDRLLLISTDVVGARVEGHRAAIEAAVAAGVTHIAYTSIPEPTEDNPAGVVPDHAATEQILRESGVAWTMLRNNLYADMQVPTVQQAIATGRLVTNAGEGATAYVTRADCAAAAVAVLLGKGADDTAYDVTGPQALGAADLAAIAAELGGTPVEVVQVSDEEYAAGLVEGAGLPPEVAELLTSFGTSARLGKLATVSTAVQDLTGEAPTALRDVLAPALG